MSENYEFVIFYFAGHGAVNEFGTYLVSTDSDPVDVGIDLDHLRRLASRSTVERVTMLIILDCCHSGAATVRDSGSWSARDITYYDIERSMPALGTGKVIIAACRPHELAYEEPSLKHGVFTYYLLEGLYGDAADSQGDVTVPNLYDYVSGKFGGRVVGQTPIFRGDIAGRLVMGKNLKPRERSEIPKDQIRDIETEAQRLMNEYIQVCSVDIETWKVETYRDACSMLPPRLRWFEREVTRYPRLSVQPRFDSAYSTAKAKLADLANLMAGLETRIGRVESKLGSGTFGSVWLIRPECGPTVAYKVYHPIDLNNSEKLARFNRGYRAMAQLDHPHIVKVREFTDCPVGFVMDHIDGPNLRDFAALGHSAVDSVLQLLTVGETLKYTHSRDVVHRDVKPENIIVHLEQDTGSYRPYLTDFDLAWFSTATQFTRNGFGSLIYAAPEQLAKPRSSAAHGVTTDVYAFGQLCFFLICRRDPVPLLSDNIHALREELRSWGFEEPAHKFIGLYEACTQQKPEDRIQDFRDICDRLFEISQLLHEADHEKTIGFDRFMKQLVFSIVGMSPERIQSNTTFLTTSGQTQINVEAVDAESEMTEICFCLRVQMLAMMEGVSHQDARQMINRRIDTALSEFPSAQRRAGKQAPFETFIRVREVPMSIDGVEICRQILMRVVDCIERG